MLAGVALPVLVDAAETSIIENAERIVKRHFADAICTRGEAFGHFYQLRCDLGYFARSFYEHGAAKAEELLKDISETGASIRFGGIRS